MLQFSEQLLNYIFVLRTSVLRIEYLADGNDITTRSIIAEHAHCPTRSNNKELSCHNVSVRGIQQSLEKVQARLPGRAER